jgi:hypothetical protein
MKKFFNYLFKLLIIVVLTLYFLEFAYSYVYQNGKPRNKVSYLLAQENENIDYIFIGSSRVDNGVDPIVISRKTGKTALNLGIQGAIIDDYLLILKLIDKQNIDVEKIFIQIDYVYNYENYSDIINSMLIPYINDPLIYNELQVRQPDIWRLKNIPFYKYMLFDYRIGFREFFSTLIRKEPRIALESGYYPLYNQLPRSGELPMSIPGSNKAFEKIKEIVSKNNWDVIYYTAPICDEIKNRDYLIKLKTKIPELINLADVFKGKPEYFHDCVHLLDSGAKAFTEIMIEKFIYQEENNE